VGKAFSSETMANFRSAAAATSTSCGGVAGREADRSVRPRQQYKIGRNRLIYIILDIKIHSSSEKYGGGSELIFSIVVPIGHFTRGAFLTDPTDGGARDT